MDLPGFDIYRFPSTELFYAARRWELELAGREMSFILELLITEGCHHASIKQGGAKNPNFFVKNSAEKLKRSLASSVVKSLRGVLLSCPAGDTVEGCYDNVKDLTRYFSTLAMPEGDVTSRIPVVLSKGLDFENKLGNRRDVNRAVFEMKPQHYGYLICTEEGLTKLLEGLQNKLKPLQSA